jgi:hypothetical protein
MAKTKHLFINFTPELYQQICEIVEEYGLTKTKIIERALIRYIKEIKESGRI